MEDYPKTLTELENRFSNENACKDYLFKLRWPDGFRCPRCNSEEYWKMDTGAFWCKKCNYKASVIAGTIFEGTHKPLRLWFRVIWLVTSQKYGASAKGLQRMLGIGSYRTAWLWLHKLRRAMVRPGRDKIAGIVEVDEIFIGGEKHDGKRGRGSSGKSLVLVAVEKNEKRLGRLRLLRIKDASAVTLENAIETSIAEGSTIRTDAWNGYNGIERIGFKREIIKKDATVGENLLPGCNLVASLLKRWLNGTLQGAVSHEHLDYYLDEYTFRFNRRTSNSRGKLFFRLLEHAMVTDVTTYKQIKKGVRGVKKEEIYNF
jgi:transposase-like protein